MKYKCKEKIPHFSDGKITYMYQIKVKKHWYSRWRYIMEMDGRLPALFTKDEVEKIINK